MSIISRFKDKIQQYIDVQLKLFKLSFIGTTANVLSYFIFLLIGLFIFFCILMFLGMGITELFVMLGFTRMAALFMTIGVYILLLGLLILLRRPVTRFFASGVITVLTDSDKDDDDDDKDDKK